MSVEARYGLFKYRCPDNPKGSIIIFAAHTYSGKEQIEYWENALKDINDTRVLAVHGPKMPLTYDNGKIDHSWFDYLTNYCEEKGPIHPSRSYPLNADREDLINEEQLMEAREAMKSLVEEEAGLVGNGNVYLCGSSQGAYIALDVGLSLCDDFVGGIFAGRGALGSYSFIKSKNAEVVIYYGDCDEIIGMGLVENGIRRLKNAGVKVSSMIERGLTHNGDPKGEIECMKATLERWLNK